MSSRRDDARAGHSLIRIQEWLPLACNLHRFSTLVENRHRITRTSQAFQLHTWGFPCSLSPGDLPAKTVHVHTAGRCCLYRAAVRFDDTNMLTIPRTGVQGRERNTIASASQVTISGNTSGCKRACHQFPLNALACSVFLSPPDVVLH